MDYIQQRGSWFRLSLPRSLKETRAEALIAVTDLRGTWSWERNRG
jgi:hypothetical protein